MARGFDLSAYGIHAPDVIGGPSLGLLYEDGVVCDGDWITSEGALATNSGDRTRRSPLDRYIVADPESETDVEWGPFNQKLAEKSFDSLRKQAIDYFNTRGRLYVVEGFAGRDTSLRIKVRVVCARPYHALFMQGLLVRPTTAELAEFGKPDVVILNAGQTPADPKTPGLSSAVSVAISLERGEVVILGTDYAAEMKAALVTFWSLRLPRLETLCLRGAAIEAANGEVTLLAGPLGSGKTTLAAGSGQKLIADDAVAWNKRGVFGLEASCYARCQGLSEAEHPEIYRAVRFGALLENVTIDPRRRTADYGDMSLTENTRVLFPREHLPAVKASGEGAAPTNVVLLACDALGVLPPVSRLTPQQAAYYFLSGYSSKPAATAGGTTESVFSPCFGAGLLLLSASQYVEAFRERLADEQPAVWLVNTGWVGGDAESGERLDLATTRKLLTAIQSGALEDAPTAVDPVFGLAVVKSVPGVEGALLTPWEAWGDRDAYRQAALRLAEQFQQHAQKFAGRVGAEILAAGPKVTEAIAN